MPRPRAEFCITEIRKKRDVRNDDVLYSLALGPFTISRDVTPNLSSVIKPALQGKQNDIIHVVWVELGCVRLIIFKDDNTHKFVTNFFSLRSRCRKGRESGLKRKREGFCLTIREFSKRFFDFTKQWKLKQMIFSVHRIKLWLLSYGCIFQRQ